MEIHSHILTKILPVVHSENFPGIPEKKIVPISLQEIHQRFVQELLQAFQGISKKNPTGMSPEDPSGVHYRDFFSIRPDIASAL